MFFHIICGQFTLHNQKLFLQIYIENNIHSEVLSIVMSEIKDRAIKKLVKSEETK